jgi:hypothetical protein
VEVTSFLLQTIYYGLIPGKNGLNPAERVPSSGWMHSGTSFSGEFTRLDRVSFHELTVSLTPNFAPGTTFPMFGRSYRTGTSTAEFIAGVLFVDDSFATIEGVAKFDRRTGEIASLSGTFIQDSVRSR